MRSAADRHLVLVGGGHSHLAVLRSFAMSPVRGVRLSVVSPDRLTIYSGLIPSMLAGRSSLEDAAIDVAALAARAGAIFLEEAVTGLDPDTRSLTLSGGGSLRFDLLSVDAGSTVRGSLRYAKDSRVIPVRPIPAAADVIDRFLDDAHAGRVPPHIAVVGGGAGGIELAFALQSSLGSLEDVQVMLLERAEQLLPDIPQALGNRVRDLLETRGIRVRRGLGDIRLGPQGIESASGEQFSVARAIWATGAEPHAWLQDAGLAKSVDGFLLVGDDLRCRGTEAIFAAGDCARLTSHPDMPRSGVYAVREGPVLAHNLRVAARGARGFQRYRPQRDFLRLLDTGDGSAFALYRGRGSHRRAWGRLKAFIDRRFVAKYSPPRKDRLRAPAKMGEGAMEPCGGCAAKLPPFVLEEALGNTTERDDAAILEAVGDGRIVATTDAFPPFVDDLRVVAEIGAVNAASDVYAMGGRPTHALVLAGLPENEEAGAALRAILAGAETAFSKMNTQIVGGHTVSLPEPLLGFTVLGNLAGKPLTKAGAREGDLLVLTKPLGTGVLLAASRAGECPADWHRGVLAKMRQTNAAAAEVFVEADAHAATDISGFGFLGHLLEILDASGAHADIEAAALPALPGSRELLDQGWRSSATPALAVALDRVQFPTDIGRDSSVAALMTDPQTSGGLLGAIAPDRIPWLERAASDAGMTAHIVGSIESPQFDTPSVRLRR